MASMKVTMASKKGESEDSNFVTRESDDMLLIMPNGLVYKRLCKPNLLDTKTEAKINSYCNVGNGVKKLKEMLSKDELSEFRKTAFGYWLDIGELKCVNGQLMILLTLNHVEPMDTLHAYEEISFSICGRLIKFTKKDFQEVSGFRFGSSTEKMENYTEPSDISKRYFNGQMNVTREDVKIEFERVKKNKNREALDAVKLGLLYMLGTCIDNKVIDQQVMEDGLEEGQKMESVIDNVEIASQAAPEVEELDPAIWDISPYSEQPKVVEGIISYLFATEQVLTDIPTEPPQIVNDIPNEPQQMPNVVPIEPRQVLTDIPTKQPQILNDISTEPQQVLNDDPSDGIDAEPQLNVGQLEDIQDEQAEGLDAEEQHTKDIAIDQPEDTTRQGPQTSKQKAIDGGDDNSQPNNVEAEAGMAEKELRPLWGHDETMTKTWYYGYFYPDEWMDDVHVTVALKFMVMKAQEYGLTQPFAVRDSLFVSLLKREYDNYLGKRKTIAEAALNTSILKPIVGAVPELGGRWEECDYVYMPINTGNHWILVVLDISKKCIRLYDSNSKGKTSRHTKPYLPCLQILLPKVMDKLEVYKERKMPEMGDDVLGIVNVNDCPQQQDA
ncbi:unnamed protein product [Cuscuta campestris]|uniref:Ubiquitin-like protease family profile domain-containing protein n=1 Tax=Cuscuta campestris TaxID=132261 RepID=A0A484K5J4_9ASTE|nr:unnamed protein product [Cuscuta campestris]